MSREQWLSLAAVMEITGWSRRHILRLAAGGVLRSRDAQDQAKRPGRARKEYDPSAECFAQFQKELVKFYLRQVERERTAHSDALVPISEAKSIMAHASLFAAPAELIPLVSELADLSDEQRAVAQQRLEAIMPLLEWKLGMAPGFRKQDGTEFTTANDLADFLAAQHEVEPRTLWKWKKRYEQGGMDTVSRFKALADRARKDRGTFRIWKQYPVAVEYALVKYLGFGQSDYLEAARELSLPSVSGLDYQMPRYKSEELPMTAVYAGIEREWPQWYNHGSRPPCYRSLVNLLGALPECVKVRARQGKRAYENRCEPHGRRNYATIGVNEWWVSDHRIFDIFCVNDYFPEFLQERDSWMRVWLTTMEDVRSRRVLGWAFSVNPSSRSVAAAMRMAAMRFGLPKMIYMDNGVDYVKFAESLEAQFAIEHTKAKPFRPRSKPVESWHAILSERFDRLFGPAYAGHDAKLRSEDNTLALRQHKLWREGKAPTTPLLPVSSLVKLFESWIETEYNEWTHGGQAMDGLSPRALFDRDLPEAQRTPMDVARLAPLFWDRQLRVVRNARVQIWNQQYEPADAESDYALRMLPAGAEVSVACNPDDLAYALCYDASVERDQPFIARLVAPQLMAWGPVAQQAIEEREKANARFRRFLASTDRKLASIATARGFRSELDVLAERSGLDLTKSLGPAVLPPGDAPATEPVRMAVGASPRESREFAADFARRFREEESE